MALQRKIMRKRGQATQKGYFLKYEKGRETMTSDADRPAQQRSGRLFIMVGCSCSCWRSWP